MKFLRMEHNPQDWRLIIGLFVILMLPSVLVTHIVYMKESYGNMKLLLENI